MSLPQWIAILALVALYVFLLGDWFHRAWVALGLAGLLVLSGTITPFAAFHSIDWNTIFLLSGMMVLVAFLGEAGLFRWLGQQALTWSRGKPWRLLWLFYIITAVVSAFLDNVTTVLLLSPILIDAAEELGTNPVPLLMVEVMASNLGGMATLIGDPPNILIGTAAHLSFGEFVRFLGPAAVLALVLLAVVLPRFITLQDTGARPPSPRVQVTTQPELPGLLVIMGLMLVAFVGQHQLHVPVGGVALVGAATAAVYTRGYHRRWPGRIDVGTLGFFVGVFVLVGGLESSGFIRMLAGWLDQPSLGPWMALVLFLGTAVFSALLDNVPLVAALVPVLGQVVSHDARFGVELWLAVGLGAAIGGNATIVGASANVIAQGIALERGYSMSFRDFSRLGLKVAGFTALLGAAYLTLRF